MGWALDNLGQAQCQAIIQDLVPGLKPNGNRLLGHCPFPGHDDKNPSFEYRPADDRYRCYSHPDDSEASGDLVDLWARLNGVYDGKEALKRFVARHAPHLAKGGAKPGSEAKRPSTAESGGHSQSKPAPKDRVIPQSELDALPPLPESWIQRLVEVRGWSREMIQKLDLRLWIPPDWMQNEFKRVAIPIRNSAGDLVNIRLYLAGGRKDDKVKSFWTGSRKKGNFVSYGTPRIWPLQAPPGLDREGAHFLVEGEPDCICALSQGLNAITATAGAGTWRHEWSRRFSGKDVVICYDQDDPGIAGATKAADSLARAGARVRVIKWPGFMKEGQDLTDWFVTHGKSAGELLELADEAEVWQAPEGEAQAQSWEASPPEWDQLFAAADELRRYKRYSAFDQKEVFRPMLLIKDILQEQRLIYEEKTKKIFWWNGRYWAASNLHEIKRLAMSKAGVAATRNRLGEIVDLVLAAAALPEGQEMDIRPELLCVKNGMLDLNTGRLLAHDPEYLCTHQLPYDWTPHTPPDCRRFKRYLLEAIKYPEVIDEVLEFIGYCLWHGQQYKKALLLIGPKDSGKSLLLQIIRALLGPERCCAVNMADLEDQFQRVALYRNWANIAGEASANFYTSDNFKRITGGDPLQGAYKGVDTFTFTSRAKQLFAANTKPKVSDHSDAFFERMLLVEFPRQFKLGEPGTDPHLFDQIIADELPGVFHLALARLYRLRRRGAFSQCQQSFKALNEYRLEADHVARFLLERCETQTTDGLTPEGYKHRVYKTYKDWCEESGIKKHKAANAFWLAVKRIHPDLEYRDHGPKDYDGKRPPWVKGLFLIENLPESEAA